MFTSVGILHYFFLASVIISLDISNFTVCVVFKSPILQCVSCLKLVYYWILNHRNDSAGLLIGSWATKATPVLCIHFTRKNLMIASGPAALQEDKSPHKTWTTPPLQKSPSETVLKAWLSAMLSSLSYGTMADFQYTWIGWLHFQNSYECLHVQFTWWLLMTTDKFVQGGSGLSRRLSCSFDPSVRRPVWERAGC